MMRNTHLDFYIFKKIRDKPILAIEVDGYRNHKKEQSNMIEIN